MQNFILKNSTEVMGLFNIDVQGQFKKIISSWLPNVGLFWITKIMINLKKVTEEKWNRNKYILEALLSLLMWNHQTHLNWACISGLLSRISVCRLVSLLIWGGRVSEMTKILNFRKVKENSSFFKY